MGLHRREWGGMDGTAWDGRRKGIGEGTGAGHGMGYGRRWNKIGTLGVGIGDELWTGTG